MMLADAAAQLHDSGALQHYAPLLEEIATQDDHRPYLAVAHRCQGIIATLNGDYVEAEARLSQAMILFEAMGAHWQIGRTLVAVGELSLAQSDSSRARDAYSRAMAEFNLIAAAPDVDRVRVALEALEGVDFDPVSK